MTYNDVCAIYLVFNPDINLLENSIRSCVDNVGSVYIYNNGENSDLSEKLNEFNISINIYVVNGSENIGISGLNILAKKAFYDGFLSVVILDQDSILPSGYINRAIKMSEATDLIVSPAYYDRERKSLSRCTIISKYYISKKEIISGYNPTDIVIGSGMYLTKSVWNKLNGFRDDFFLDCADFELCFQAKEKNIPIYIDGDAIMYHSIGQSSLRVLGLIVLSLHSPWRHELYYRNSLELIKDKNTPFVWKLYQIIKISMQAVIYSIFSNEKKQNCLAFLNAFRGK